MASAKAKTIQLLLYPDHGNGATRKEFIDWYNLL